MKFASILQFIILLILLVPAIGLAQFNEELLNIGRLMQGKFSSHKQSKSDSLYYDIRLSIVPIWENRTDAIWLYVEQAVSNKMNMPFRQRIYKLTQMPDTGFECAVFTLNDPIRFAGNANSLEDLIPDSLELQEGCSLYFKKAGKRIYEGGTHEKTCPSEMRGAAYASSIVILSSKMLLSWDRGFDRSNRQVWGAENGGYRYLRVRK